MSIRKLPDGRYEWRRRVNGKHLKKMFPTQREARAHDEKVGRDLQLGTHVDTTNRTTVYQFAEQRYRVLAPGLQPNTRLNHVWFLKHLEGTPLGNQPIVKASRSPLAVNAWLTSQLGSRRPGTSGDGRKTGAASVRRLANMLWSVFDTARREEIIARNPVPSRKQLTLPEPQDEPFVPLSVAQVRAWADAAPLWCATMIIVQAALGLRISELRALRFPQDVDFMRGEVRITGQLTPKGAWTPRLKTPNSRRTLRLPDVARYALARWMATCPPLPDGTIFHTRNGRPHNLTGRLSQTYKDAALRAGLPADTSSHDLRHHCASQALAAGAAVTDVAAWLGDSVETVLATYAHVMPDREDIIRGLIDKAWEQPQDDTATAAD